MTTTKQINKNGHIRFLNVEKSSSFHSGNIFIYIVIAYCVIGFLAATVWA